ncbi:MAG: DUF3788 family protein [Planctomycetota bacterium]
MNSNNGKNKLNNHPFVKKDPKPTRARLVSLLDPLGRKRYRDVERFMATIDGATSSLFHYSTNWGWAVRYLMGAKTTLCTLHLLPHIFEVTVILGKEMDELLLAAQLTPDLKRRIARDKLQNDARSVRLPIKNDSDYASLQMLINLKVATLRAKKTRKPQKKLAVAK